MSWNNISEVEKHDTIVEKVHLIENLIVRKNNARNLQAKNTLKRSVDAAKRELEALIDKLYGVEGLRTEIADETD